MKLRLIIHFHYDTILTEHMFLIVLYRYEMTYQINYLFGELLINIEQK